MKKTITLIVAMACTLVVPVCAQIVPSNPVIINDGYESFHIIPSEFVGGNQPTICSAPFAYCMTYEPEITYSLFNSDYEMAKELIIPSFGQINDWENNRLNIFPLLCTYLNPDVGEIRNIRITQSLFNDDNLYEYVVPKFISIPETEGNECRLTGFRIVNELNEELQSIDFPSSVHGSADTEALIVKNGDSFFLVLGDYWEGLSYIYRINPTASGSSIQYVTTLKSSMRVTPTFCNRNETISVDLDENSNFHNISVISSSGVTVYSHPVNGMTHISLSTASLAPGTYIVVATDGSISKETCKIIIR